jgi:Disulphide bond corrector protein DsbC
MLMKSRRRQAGANRAWLTIGVALFGGCVLGCNPGAATSESAKGLVREEPRRTELRGGTNPVQSASSKPDEKPLTAPDPSPDNPVTATMTIRPEKLTFGEVAEILVFVRIAPAHYVHAANRPDEPWIPLTVNVSLPDEFEYSGDWQFSTPEKGHGGALVYRNSVLLRRPLRTRLKSRQARLRVTGEFRYQACNDELCWPPRTIKLSASVSISDQAR